MSVRTQRNSLPLLCLDFKKDLLVPGWYEYFRDDFDDGILRPEWLTYGIGTGRTITEAGGVCTIEITNGTHGGWWCAGQNDAPRMYFELGADLPCRIETKLNLHTVNAGWTHAGIMVARDPTGVAAGAPQASWDWGRFLDTGGGWDGIYPIAQCAYGGLGLQAAGWDTDGPYWLRVEISTAKVLSFYASKDNVAWTLLGWTQAYNHDPLYVGLVCKNLTGAPNWVARAAPFEYFLIEEYKSQHPDDEECLAPIDTRAPTKFYDGRIKQMSSLKRAEDDKTGLFQVSDLSITLANEDKHYSQKMANHFLKNQEAILYHAWTEEAEALKTEIIKLIVDDHSLKGTDFIIKFKDITQKYFTKKVPENICTLDEFPNIHPDYEGWCMPEVLGNALLPDTYELPGAVQAVYVDINGGGTRDYLAARGWLRSAIDNDNFQVYEEGVGLVGGVTMTAHTDGHSYINYNPVDADASVSFNCYGYSIPIWNSENNCIQNLAYIIQYFLRFIMGIPHSLVNSASFVTLAGYYEYMGVENNGYLILQDRVDAMEILRQLLFTGGAKSFMAMDGRFNVERKNICNWEITDIEHHIFEQIELFGSPERKWNLTAAINTVNAQFGLIPWQDLYTGARSEYIDNDYGPRMEDEIRRERPRRERR